MGQTSQSIRINFCALAAVALLAGSAEATTRHTHRCPPRCEHRESTKPQKAAKRGDNSTRYTSRSSTGVWNELLTGLEFQAGFRWQEEHECPTIEQPVPPPPRHVDPFYLGVGVRLPLSPAAGLFGNFDRDFTDSPDWQARTGIFWTPWR